MDHRGRLGRVGVGRGAVAEISGEDMLRRELQEPGGYLLDLTPKFPQMNGYCAQRYARGIQLHGHRQLLRTGHQELVVATRDWFEYSQFHRFGDRFVVGASAELHFQFRAGDAVGPLVRPWPVYLGHEPENTAESASCVPGLQQLLDAGQGVTAVQQVGDLPEPGQMGVAVHVGPAPPFRGRQQPAVLVGADGADRGAAGVREVLDPVLGSCPAYRRRPGGAHSGGFSRAIPRSTPGLSRDTNRAAWDSGVTGATAWLRTTALRIASATFSGG